MSMDGMAAVDSILFGLAIASFIYWCLQWYIHILAILYGKWKLNRVTPQLSPECQPGITILKPLTGVDPNLYSNLESFFHIAYPAYELMFCVEDDTDSAIMVVRSLQLKYPNISAKLFIGAQKVGVNPKINNMIQGYQAAKYDLILISDSGLCVKEDTLSDMVSALKEDVGLIHQMPFVCDKEGFAGVLEKIYFGTYHAKMYLSADFFGINCVTGMSCLFRKDVLEEAGGLRSLGHYLAEDYYLGQVFQDRGWKIRISSQTASQNAGNCSLSNFQARMRRWTKLRAALVPFTVLLEPISDCMLLGLIASWSVNVLLNWSAVAFFFVHVLIWFILDYTLLKTIQNGPLQSSKFELVCGWLFRECTTLYVMLQAHMEPVITWRSRRYIIKAGAVGEEVRTKSYV